MARSIRLKMLYALVLLSFSYSLLLNIFPLLYEIIANDRNPLSVQLWHKTHLVDPVSTLVANVRSDELHTALTQFIKDTSAQFTDMPMQAIAVVDENARLLAQAGNFQFIASDLGAQLPISSRDDLSDALTGHFNNGIESVSANTYLVIKASNHSQFRGAILVQQSWPAKSFPLTAAVLLEPEQAKTLAQQVLLLTLFLTPAGALLIFLISARLRHRLYQLAGTINAWSTGDFSARINIDGVDEIEGSFQALNHMAQQLENRLAMERELSVLSEREQLASELHDTVKQQLFSNNLLLAGCKQLLPQPAIEGPSAQISELLGEVIQQNQLAFSQVSQLVENRLPTSSAPCYLSFAEQVQQWQSRTGVKVEYKSAITVEQLSVPIQQLLQQVLREALQNVFKHSKASRVRVSLFQQADLLNLTIHDNGLGADDKAEQGQGLQLLHQRMQQNGGALTFTARQPQHEYPGVQIQVCLKL
ncbi:MAG: hypothetical protein KKF79_14170 [Gammaproteobacteria bacterium]|nr:hypothetical protein [Gammaproteobacteria bacterium]